MPSGYTLIEITVALFLFTVGALALVATSAVVGRELSANGARERAGRIAGNRLETLAAACRQASSGRETLGRIESRWSVDFSDSSRVSLVESVTYPTLRGGRNDLYHLITRCSP